MLGPLKRVWRTMDSQSIQWVTLDKPPLKQLAPVEDAAAPEAA